jgi:hypothetical protein
MMKRRRQGKRKSGLSQRKEIAGLRAWSAVDVVIGARNINGGQHL